MEPAFFYKGTFNEEAYKRFFIIFSQGAPSRPFDFYILHFVPCRDIVNYYTPHDFILFLAEFEFPKALPPPSIFLLMGSNI
jgi:hypothetical protein